MTQEELDQELYRVIYWEDDDYADKAQELLEKGANPYAEMEDRMYSNIIEFVKLERPYTRIRDILYNAVNKKSPIWQAIEWGGEERVNIKALKKAIKNKENLWHRNIYGHLPLECAAISGDYEAVILLAKAMMKEAA